MEFDYELKRSDGGSHAGLTEDWEMLKELFVAQLQAMYDGEFTSFTFTVKNADVLDSNGDEE